MASDRADLVVVGAGTVGGWASVFARADGVGRVVVVERGLVGMGASSRAAGIVRAQGGTPATVALGRWSIDFYNGQRAAYGTDSGFRELGYLILAVTEDDERAGRERVAMQRANGLDVSWLDAAEAAATAVTLAPTVIAAAASSPPTARSTRRATSAPIRSRCRPPASSSASGRRSPASGPVAAAGGGTRVVAVETDAGPIETDRVLLTGGPSLRAVGRLAGIRIPVGAARHTVAVLEPHPAFDVPRHADGLRHRRRAVLAARGRRPAVRLERPGRGPGRGARDRLGVLRRDARPTRRRSSRPRAISACAGSGSRPSTTPPTTCRSSVRVSIATAAPIDGVTVASPGGHGMMWGPGVARVAADLVDARHDGRRRRDRARARPVRRAGTQPARDRPDRAAVPGQRRGRRGGRGVADGQISSSLRRSRTPRRPPAGRAAGSAGRPDGRRPRSSRPAWWPG